ncbi:unnamed protein product [Trichogramma brassicae]|uniref:Uncharacterized protein n=1 Tax=Trichogramma brassicae TaxID=86971 RepID=A0A6H5ID44_9HYME|nr:unnamed protein product [Trichogramma brassicae]
MLTSRKKPRILKLGHKWGYRGYEESRITNPQNVFKKQCNGRCMTMSIFRTFIRLFWKKLTLLQLLQPSSSTYQSKIFACHSLQLSQDFLIEGDSIYDQKTFFLRKKVPGTQRFRLSLSLTSEGIEPPPSAPRASAVQAGKNRCVRVDNAERSTCEAVAAIYNLSYSLLSYSLLCLGLRSTLPLPSAVPQLLRPRDPSKLVIVRLGDALDDVREGRCTANSLGSLPFEPSRIASSRRNTSLVAISSRLAHSLCTDTTLRSAAAHTASTINHTIAATQLPRSTIQSLPHSFHPNHTTNVQGQESASLHDLSHFSTHNLKKFFCSINCGCQSYPPYPGLPYTEYTYRQILSRGRAEHQRVTVRSCTSVACRSASCYACLIMRSWRGVQHDFFVPPVLQESFLNFVQLLQKCPKVAGNRALGVCACASLEAHYRHYAYFTILVPLGRFQPSYSPSLCSDPKLRRAKKCYLWHLYRKWRPSSALRVDRADDHHRKLSVPRALVELNVPSEASCNFANCTDEKIILVAFLGNTKQRSVFCPRACVGQCEAERIVVGQHRVCLLSHSTLWSLQPYGLADAARPGLHAATAPGHRRLLLSQAREAPRALPLQREPPTSTWLSQVRSVQRGSQGPHQIPLPGHQTRGALQASVHQATALMGLQADHHLRPLRCDLLSRLLARRGRKVSGLCRVQPRHDIGRRELFKRIPGIDNHTHILAHGEKKDKENVILVDCINDLIMLLADLNRNESMIRKNIIMAKISPTLKETLMETKCGEFLFGEKLDEVLKSKKALDDSVKAFKNPQKSSTDKPKNWKTPSASKTKYTPRRSSGGSSSRAGDKKQSSSNNQSPRKKSRDSQSRR